MTYFATPSTVSCLHMNNESISKMPYQKMKPYQPILSLTIDLLNQKTIGMGKPTPHFIINIILQEEDVQEDVDKNTDPTIQMTDLNANYVANSVTQLYHATTGLIFIINSQIPLQQNLQSLHQLQMTQQPAKNPSHDGLTLFNTQWLMVP